MYKINPTGLAVLRELAEVWGLNGEQSVRVIDALSQEHAARLKAEEDLAKCRDYGREQEKAAARLITEEFMLREEVEQELAELRAKIEDLPNQWPVTTRDMVSRNTVKKWLENTAKVLLSPSKKGF